MTLNDIINKIESLKKELESLKPIKTELEKKIWHKLRLDWNFHSNHIEGNSLTFGETKVLLETGHIAGTLTKPKRDYDEVIGHDKAIDIIIEITKNNNSLTEAIIRELHKTILPTPYKLDAETPEGKPTKREILIGEYKRQPNHVLTSKGEKFYFATPDETKPQMTDLVDSFRDRKAVSAKDILFLASEFHYKFVLIHPFDDGNGRIARLLLNYFLLLNDYPPLIIRTDDKKNYFTALEASDAGNFESLVIYLGEQITRSLQLMIRGAKGEEISETDDIDKEILLLDKKLESLGRSEIREEKKEKTVLNVFNESIIPLITSVFTKASKFDNYFKEQDILYNINNSLNTQDKESFLNSLLNKISEPDKIQNFSFYYRLNGFKKAGVNDFNVSEYLHFTFEKYKYILHYSNSVVFENLYDQILSVEDIDRISNEVANNILLTINRNIENIIKSR